MMASRETIVFKADVRISTVSDPGEPLEKMPFYDIVATTYSGGELCELEGLTKKEMLQLLSELERVGIRNE